MKASEMARIRKIWVHCDREAIRNDHSSSERDGENEKDMGFDYVWTFRTFDLFFDGFESNYSTRCII